MWPEDSDEPKAKAAGLSSLLPIHKRKEKSMWGCSPEDSDELKAKAAEFSSLPIHEKLVCLTAASFTSLAYHRELRYAREKKRELQHYDKWTSYLYKDELEMIGELDGKEAEKIYNKSQEKPYQCSCFEIRLDKKKLEQMMWMSDLTLLDDEVKSASSFNEEFFADREIKSDKQKVESFILEDKLRTKMLEGRESYLMKMEGAMHKKRIGKTSKFNQSDEGACSETKFNQSDDKKRKEMLHKKKKKMARATEERLPEFVW